MDFDSTAYVAQTIWRDGVYRESQRFVPQETPVAFSYSGSSHAVMMATPADLIDFATGFTISEAIVPSAGHISAIDIVSSDLGIDLQITLADPWASTFKSRKRQMAGPVGCGLCGIESLEQALQQGPDLTPLARVFPSQVIFDAVARLNKEQVLYGKTHAVHGAGFYQPETGTFLMREDVGRHNALDKLCGALARGMVSADQGMIVVTSRLSVEMVQKTAKIGCPILIGFATPTALAIQAAAKSGITLIGLVREKEFTIFNHPQRVKA